MPHDPIDDCDATPAEFEAHDRRMAEMEVEIERLQQQGWTWSETDRIKRQLVDPDDPESTIWFDPYTGECLLSSKLAERLRENIARNAASNS